MFSRDSSPKWNIEFLDIRSFDKFMKGLEKPKQVALFIALYYLLAENGLDLLGSPWLSRVDSAIYELRLGKTTASIFSKSRVSRIPAIKSSPILIRVFCYFYDENEILVLGAYDKGRDPNPKRQRQEILKASNLLRIWMSGVDS